MKSPHCFQSAAAFTIALATLCCAVSFANGKPPYAVEWALTLGSTNADAIQCIAVNKSGDTYIAGGFQRATQIGNFYLGAIDISDSADIFLARVDPRGQVLWAHSIQGFAGNGASSLAIDTEGNVLLSGIFSSFIYIGPTNVTGWYPDSFLAKFTPDGALLWARATSPEYVYATEMALNSHNEIYVGGVSNLHAVLSKYSPSGEKIYSRVIAPSSTITALAFNRRDRLYASVYDARRGSYLAQLADDGEEQWARGTGGTARSLAIDKKGNLLLTGEFQGHVQIENGPLLEADEPNWFGVFVSSYTRQGQFIFAESLGTGPTETRGVGIAAGRGGNWFSIGRHYYVGFLASGKYPGRDLGGNADPAALVVDNHNQLYLAGRFFYSGDLLGTNVTLAAYNGWNGFLVKLSAR